MLVIVVVLSNIDVLFRCCVLIILIAWRVLTWHHVGNFLSVDWRDFPSFSNVYLPAGTRYFVYSCGAEWRSLEFLKICPIFLDDLKIVRILCLFNILLIRSIVVCQKPLCLYIYSIVLMMSFLSCPFFCKISFKWLSSIYLFIDVLCQRWWKLYVQVSWLQTVFVLNGIVWFGM